MLERIKNYVCISFGVIIFSASAALAECNPPATNYSYDVDKSSEPWIIMPKCWPDIRKIFLFGPGGGAGLVVTLGPGDTVTVENGGYAYQEVNGQWAIMTGADRR